MKKIIIISLLTSASLITTNHAATLDDALLTARAGAGSAARVTPSTLDELEAFLRKNCGTRFPEGGFSAFCTPFKPAFAKLKRLDQMRAQNAAVDTLGQMVALGYYSFTLEIEHLKIKTPHFPDRAASRPESMAHYKRFNHSHFLKFQEMITRVLELAQTNDLLSRDAKATLTQSHGSSDTLKIAWLRDNTGIVPIPFQGNLKKIIYSSSTPYGNWGDDLQRSMVFVDGKLITAPGIDIHTKDGATYKFIQENGLKGGFVTSPVTMRMGADHPMVSTLLDMGVFRVGSTPAALSTFLTMPATTIENKEFEAAFLEELMEEDQKREAIPFGRLFLESHMTAIENISEEIMPETAAGPGSAAGIDSAPPTHPLQTYIDSLYEEQVLAEQAEVSRRVVEDSIEGKSKASKKKGKAAPLKTTHAATATADASETEEKAALRREILSTLKERGRTKWRTLARTLIAALKGAYADNTVVIKVTEKGSHFMLHIAGETSSDGATINPPSRKSRSHSLCR